MIRREQFDQLVRRVEEQWTGRPEELSRRTILWAIAGFTGLAFGFLFFIGLGLFFLIFGVLTNFSEGWEAIVTGGILLAVGMASAWKLLWMKIVPPEGVVITAEEAPELFAVLEDLQTRLHAKRFHRVVITNEANASVSQIPALGLFGWPRHHLSLGLPLMEALQAEEFRAVLAHEFAHFSKQHGRVGNWIYRLRRMWVQMFDGAQQGIGGLMRPVMSRYVKWFWPRFNAHAFVLSRLNEYAADRTAAELTSPESIGVALLRVEIVQRYLTEKFWPGVWLMANRDSQPPMGTFQRLGQSVAPDIDEGENVHWLPEAYLAITTNADTHPSLTDRTRALGLKKMAELPGLGGRKTAVGWLGRALDKTRANVEANWRKQIDKVWAKKYARAQALKDHLSTMPDASSQPYVYELWGKAWAIINLEGDMAAIGLLQQILELRPEHALANFCLGRHLLGQNDAGGAMHMMRAMKTDVDLQSSGYPLLHEYYQRTGQKERLRELEADQDRQEDEAESLMGSKVQHGNVEAHGLTTAELEPLLRSLRENQDVIAARLGRKKADRNESGRLFYLCVRVRKNWLGLSSRDREQSVSNRLLISAQLPGRVLILSTRGKNVSLAKKLENIPGSEIFRRTI